MLKLLADENIGQAIVRGLLRRLPEVDVVRVQDVGLSGERDPEVLAWAAETGRVLITHDMRTVPGYAYERVEAGERMPGVFVIPASMSMGQIIEDLLLLTQCSYEGEWEGQVRRLPL
jgi:hypothetical protein